MSEWISVEDRLPADNHDRLTAYKTGNYWRQFVQGTQFGEFQDGDHNTTMDGKVHPITHWMPLPEPPE